MRYSRLFADPLMAGLWLGCCAGLVCAASGASAQAPRATAASFDVEAYDVDGAKLLKQVDVETAVYPFLGPGRTREDIDHAREALEKAYRDRGYQSVVVELPPQSVSDNIVRLHVIEAPIGRLRVTGSRYYSPEVILHQASAFKEGEVPNINEAQRQLTAINSLPDRRVTPLLRAGEAPGTVDVDLKVSDSLPLHASVELNNDHNADTKPLRLLSTVHYDNLWQLGHSVSFTYAVAPQDRNNSEIYSGSYVAPLWGTPWSLMVFGYDSNSNVAALGGTTVLGKGYDIGVRGILKLPPLGDFYDSLTLGADYKDNAQKLNESTGGCIATKPAPQRCPTVQYTPVSLVYNLQREGPKFSTKVSVSLTASVRGVASNTATFESSRFDATPAFVHLNLDVTQTETLWRGFETSQHLAGQLSDQPLVPNEQFAAGGLTSVRGYLQSEAVGDDGFSGNLELRTPSLAPGLGGFVDDMRLYAFSDGGVLSVRDHLPDQAAFFSLASVGFGLRLQLFKYIKSDVLGALPLISGTTTHRDRPQVTFSLKSDF